MPFIFFKNITLALLRPQETGSLHYRKPCVYVTRIKLERTR